MVREVEEELTVKISGITLMRLRHLMNAYRPGVCYSKAAILDQVINDTYDSSCKETTPPHPATSPAPPPEPCVHGGCNPD